MRQLVHYGLTLRELERLLLSYKTNLDRMHLQLLSSKDILRLLMDNVACGHVPLHIEDERILATRFVEGGLLDVSSGHGRGGSGGYKERLSTLLELISTEARKLFSWMDPLAFELTQEGPDAMCAFLVEDSNRSIEHGRPDAADTDSNQNALVGQNDKMDGQMDGQKNAMPLTQCLSRNGSSRTGSVEAPCSSDVSKDLIVEQLLRSMTGPLVPRQKVVEVRRFREYYGYRDVANEHSRAKPDHLGQAVG